MHTRKMTPLFFDWTVSPSPCPPDSRRGGRQWGCYIWVATSTWITEIRRRIGMRGLWRKYGCSCREVIGWGLFHKRCWDEGRPYRTWNVTVSDDWTARGSTCRHCGKTPSTTREDCAACQKRSSQTEVWGHSNWGDAEGGHPATRNFQKYISNPPEKTWQESIQGTYQKEDISLSPWELWRECGSTWPLQRRVEF